MTIATSPWYDTREGFEKALKSGLGGLREIADARRKAGYDEKKRLKTWYILGYFCFDACGNTMVITEGRPTYADFSKNVPRVLADAELKAVMGNRHWTMTMGSVPPTVETCPRCLEGWTLRNVENYKSKHDYSTETWTHYHKNCWDLKITQGEIEFFDEILKEAGLGGFERRLIPAEYPDRPTAPWFMVETDLGPVKIGYRRRVISIEWPHAEGLKDVDGEELFKDEGVTKDHSLIHAWGKEKAVEYLKKLMAAKA
jgi:hypothetical protein